MTVKYEVILIKNITKMPINFRLDKTKFAAMSYEEAEKAMNDYSSNTSQEWLMIANRLIATAYNFPLNSPPKIDRSVFNARNLKNGKHI